MLPRCGILQVEIKVTQNLYWCKNKLLKVKEPGKHFHECININTRIDALTMIMIVNLNLRIFFREQYAWLSTHAMIDWIDLTRLIEIFINRLWWMKIIHPIKCILQLIRSPFSLFLGESLDIKPIRFKYNNYIMTDHHLILYPVNKTITGKMYKHCLISAILFFY